MPIWSAYLDVDSNWNEDFRLGVDLSRLKKNVRFMEMFQHNFPFIVPEIHFCC